MQAHTCPEITSHHALLLDIRPPRDDVKGVNRMSCICRCRKSLSGAIRDDGGGLSTRHVGLIADTMESAVDRRKDR